MKEEIRRELEALIQEQEKRISKLRGDYPLLDFNSDNEYAVYSYGKENRNYQNWLAKTKRFLSLNFHNDKYIKEFEVIGEKKLSKNQQEELLAILNAFLKYSTPIKNIPAGKTTRKETNITINNTNTQTQQQSQQQSIKILVKALEDQLSVTQLKEIKQIVVEEKGDLEKAKPKLIEKIKSFGENVASNILANIITNPAIWSCLG